MNTYLTSYCNKQHDLKTGAPVNHNCHVIPPKALQMERDGDIRQAMGIIESKRPLRKHSGTKSK